MDRFVTAALRGSLVLCLLACGDRDTGAVPEKRGAPPPPPPPALGSQSPVACTRTSVDDAASKDLFPARLEGFCLDPRDGGKALGEGSKLPLEGIADLFDGESKIYEDHGVKRVVQVRYVAEAGGTATIDIILSRFATDGGAFAMFSKRVVGDGDPADPMTPKPLAAGGAGALGTGSATVWRGPWMAEIVFNDDTKTPAEIEATGARLLEPFAKTLGDKLTGERALPAPLPLLPAEDRLPLGQRLLLKGALPGLPASPGGAVGYYRKATQRYRVIAIAVGDEAKAKDVMKSAHAQPGAAGVEGVGDDAVRSSFKEGTLTGEVLVARRGDRVFAVADELRVFGASADRDKLALSKEAKHTLLASLLP